MRHIFYILIVLLGFSSCTPEPYYEYDENPSDSSIIWYNIKPVDHTETLWYTAKLTVTKVYEKHPLGPHTEVIEFEPTLNRTYPNTNGSIGAFYSITIEDADYFNWSLGETIEEIDGVKEIVNISSVEFDMLVTPEENDLEYKLKVNYNAPITTQGEYRINVKK